MQKILLQMIIIAISVIMYGCTKATTNYINLNESNQCEVNVRNNEKEWDVTVKDEVIINNLLYLLNEVTSGDKIVLSKKGKIPYMDDRQINITGFSDDYNISFSTYYEDEYSDGGKMVVIVEKGKKVTYYYLVNDLYDFITIALNDQRTFEGKIIGMHSNQLEVLLDQGVTVNIYYDKLPENYEDGSSVEITLKELTESSKGLSAEAILMK